MFEGLDIYDYFARVEYDKDYDQLGRDEREAIRLQVTCTHVRK